MTLIMHIIILVFAIYAGYQKGLENMSTAKMQEPLPSQGLLGGLFTNNQR